MEQSKLLYSATMSLDGYIAGVGGDMSWLTEYLQDPNPEADALLPEIGALLVGNNTYGGDDPNAGTDEEGAFGGQWSGRSVVLTHDPDRPTQDTRTTLVGDFGEAVAAAKEAAGGKYVNVLGANVARQCIEAGVLDEVLVFPAAVMLGDGVPLFAHDGGTRIRLEPLHHSNVERPRGLWFRVVWDGAARRTPNQ